MLGNNVSMGEALLVTVVCMLIVFATLYALALILESFKSIFKEKEESKVESNKVPRISNTENAEQINTSRATVIDNLETEEEIVVAISAAIAASNGNKNKRIHIKSIKLLG